MIKTQYCWALLGIILFGCGQHKIAPLPADARIVAFGDSLTQGVGASSGHDYPTILATLISQSVINAGVSGETTTQGVARFANVLDKYQPHLVLLLEGGNDFLHNINDAQITANLSTMIKQAKQRDIKVVLIAVPKKSLILSPASLYTDLADKYDLLLIKNTVTDLLKTPALKADIVHFNDKGYRHLAEQIKAQLVQAGAI